MVSASRLWRHFGSLFTVLLVIPRSLRIIGPYAALTADDRPPPGGGLSSAVSGAYGPMIRKLRSITNKTVNKEPKWRHNRDALTTGYEPRWKN